MTGHTSFDELLEECSKPWYRYGKSSPGILIARWRNGHRPIFRLRMTWQRATRGYDDSMLWSLDYSLAKLTVVGVQAMRKWKNGYPSEFAEPEHGGNGGGWEAWDDILRRIEEGFQVWLDEDGWFDKPDQEAKFKEAMELYAHWFNALWD